MRTDDLDEIPDPRGRLLAEAAAAVFPDGAAPAPRSDQEPEERETKHHDHPEVTMNGPIVNEVDARRDVPPPGDDDAPFPTGRPTPPSPVGSVDLCTPAPLFTGPPNRGFLPEDPPPFPVGALPGWLANWVRAAPGATKVSVDVAASVALGVASWAAAWAPRGTPMLAAWGPMIEPLVLYTCAVEKSGANKTGIFSAAVTPLRELERELIAEGSAERNEMTAARAAALAKRDAFKRALDSASKAKADGKRPKGDPPEVIAEALADALQELADTPEPVTPDVVVDDSTPQAVVRALASAPVACVATSEGHAIFQLASGRYGNGANLEPYLKAFDGKDPIKVRRILREGEDVPFPLMSVVTTTQVETLDELGSMPGNLGPRGLLGRFIWVWAHSVLGARSAPSHGRPIPSDVRDAYRRGIRALYDARPAVVDGETVPMALDEEAITLADGFFDATEPRMSEGGDLEWCSSMASKMRSQLLRIAGILHLADGCSPSEAIGVDVMARALDLADYFLVMGIRTWRRIVDGEEPPAAKLWRILRDRSQPIPDTEIAFAQSQNPHIAIVRTLRGMTERALFEAVKRTVDDMEGLRGVVRALIGAGYVAALDRPHSGPGRPPGPWIVLNPEADR